RGVLGDLKSALDDGKLEWEELADVALNALDKIIDKLLDDLLDAIFQVGSASRGGGGGGILGFLGSLFGGGRSVDPWAGLRSFDGGGSTGFGPRVGGVDGKGGFPAILHPNEVVIDRTKS